MHLFVYDPATNTLEERGEIVPGLGGEVRPLAVGPDGRIYGTGTRGNRVGLYIYDPKLRKVVKDFGPVGPSHPNGAWSRYVMGVDDTHAYIASGMIPAWYLVAVNLQTGEEKVLLESPTERVMDIVESFPGAWVIVPQGGGAPNKEYWLYHGQAIAKTSDTPPWPPKASPWDKGLEIEAASLLRSDRPRRRRQRDALVPLGRRRGKTLGQRESRSSRCRGRDARRPRLETDPRQGRRDLSPSDQSHDAPARRPALRHGRRLLRRVRLRSQDRPDHDPRPPPGARALHADRLRRQALLQRLRGRAALRLRSRSALDVGQRRAARPSAAAAGRSGQQSPVAWALSSKDTRVAIAHRSAIGADGRVYFGGFGERNYTGGGFGWYDPKTEKLDGFWKPLSGYAVHWIAPRSAAG